MYFWAMVYEIKKNNMENIVGIYQCITYQISLSNLEKCAHKLYRQNVWQKHFQMMLT